MIRYGLIITFFVLSFVSTGVLYAQSDTDDFTIQVFPAEDTTPPTTPTLVSATPVATTQVNLVWNVSTDNFAVFGYIVERDGVPVATTTLTSFSDSGLTASTTYLYTIRAFDTGPNYSSSSNSIATTTFALPPPPVPGDNVEQEGGNGTSARVVLDELQIFPTLTTATFMIEIARPARFELRWGRTASYELGYVVNDYYLKRHETTLTDLEPGTTYEYELIGYTPFGIQTILKRGTFTTTEAPNEVAPANVLGFTGVVNGDDVVLTWNLPKDTNVADVRIVRSHLGYPSYPNEGAIIYQGKGERIVDNNILSEYSPVYYTAFVYDSAGNVSSGAVVRVFAVRPLPDGEIGEPEIFPTPSFPWSTTTDTVVVAPDRVLPSVIMPDASLITVTQNDIAFTLLDEGPIMLDTTTSFIISIPADSISKNLKTIIVTIVDPTNNLQSHVFLLRLNKDQTMYQAVVAPFAVEGSTKLMIEIYDYESYVVARYVKSLLFSPPVAPTAMVIFPDAFFTPALYSLVLIIILVLTAICFALWRFFKSRK